MKKYIKRIGLAGGTLALIVAGAGAFSAFEAHIINVTARIENALTVPLEIEGMDFGTVFPEEVLHQNLDINLSGSFLEEDRVDDIEYIIRQKPKCGIPIPQTDPVDYSGFVPVTENSDGNFVCPDVTLPGAEPVVVASVQLPLLCPDLSKHEITTDGQPTENDGTGIDAFHGPGTGDPWTLADTIATEVEGKLAKAAGDISDTWDIDLHVPPFRGQIAQDDDIDPIYHLDPADEHEIFGCDLWVEVTEVSLPGGTYPTPAPGNGTLTITKVINNTGGGTAVNTDFSFTVNAGASTPFEADGSNAQSVVAGNYTVVEDAETGYTTSYSNDFNANADCNNLAVASSGSVTCTITNTFVPLNGTLRITKVLDNSDGFGTKTNVDFSYKVNLGASTPFEADGSNDESVVAGTYDVVEDAETGYSTTYSNSLNANADCDDLAVVASGTVTCTITNTVIFATLTVTKVVTVNDGGDEEVADFILSVNNGVGIVTSGTPKKVAPGSYKVSETGVSGYDATFSGDCDLDGNITLAATDNKTCTITNDDIKPNITLHKIVVGGPNAGNPGAFTMRIDGISVSNGSSKLVTANAAHTISEDAVSNYTGTMSGDAECPLVLGGTATLDEGEHIDCTITNTFTPPV